MDESLNVFDEALESCSEQPLTGFFRDGCCNTSDQDAGSHTVCVKVTADFLEFSRFRGNDLSTPDSSPAIAGAYARLDGSKPTSTAWRHEFICAERTNARSRSCRWLRCENSPST
jgi:uncharacterized protein (DUF2237 family)